MKQDSPISSNRGYTIRECPSADCGLRLPVLRGDLRGETCPRCGTPMHTVSTHSLKGERPLAWPTALTPPLYVLLDNVRSAFNVGSIIRIADGVGIEHLYTCGITPKPDSEKVKKTALGAERDIAWTAIPNALKAAIELRDQDVELWALENVYASTALIESALPESEQGVCLVVGNEVVGIDPGLLAMCNRTLYIPMQGAKGSLNVAVAFGIAAYWLRGTTSRPDQGRRSCA
jgi:23S rRNA (guanosine2251-2'-O)-methyltransferase